MKWTARIAVVLVMCFGMAQAAQAQLRSIQATLGDDDVWRKQQVNASGIPEVDIVAGGAAGLATAANQVLQLANSAAIIAKLIVAPSTEAKQDLILALLTTIDADTGAILAKIIAAPATEAKQLPDGHNVTVDNASIPVTGTFWQVTQPVSAAALPLPALASTSTLQTTANASLAVIETNTTAGTVTDSAAVAQQGDWLDVTDGSSPDGNFGVIPNASIAAGTPVKLYALPPAKEYHEIAITYTNSAAGDFDYTVMILAVNDIPTAWALNDWMSVGALVVPSWRLSRDRTETLIAQPLIRTQATYLVVIIDTAAAAPATDPQVRILSYNNGDSR
jgi:hypothetical protein